MLLKMQSSIDKISTLSVDTQPDLRSQIFAARVFFECEDQSKPSSKFATYFSYTAWTKQGKTTNLRN